MKNNRPGALRHRLSLESATKTPDGGGGETIVWDVVTTLWAAIRPLQGHEQLDAGQFASRVTHEIILRYRPGVLPQMRFRKDTRIFEIRAVLDRDEEKRWLSAQCVEREL